MRRSNGWVFRTLFRICAGTSVSNLAQRVPVTASTGCDDARRAVNVPSKLLACLEVQQSVHGRRPLLIQISTDQVCTQ